MKQKPTLAQVASATVTPQMLEQVVQELKQSIVLLVTEVVARCLCEITYDIHDRNVSKLTLPLKVGVIATNATNAANKLSFGPAVAPVDKTMVKDTVMAKCFPNPAATEPSSSTQRGSDKQS